MMSAGRTGHHTTWSALRAPVAVGALGLGAAALLRLRDPHGSGSYGYCPFLSLTGQPCPGCGGLRAINDLTHGEIVAAVSSNAFAVVLAASLTILWAVWLVRRARGQRDAAMASVGARGTLVLIPLVAVFGIVRVTPWGSWLAP